MQLDRRTVFKWVLAAGAAAQLPEFALAVAAEGYGKDPDLMKAYKAGELWPLLLTDTQRLTTTVLCDVIIPADEQSPAASAVAVPAFIDEWISAPYPAGKQDRNTITQGLLWLDTESQRRFACDFAKASAAQMRAICDDISNRSQAKAPFVEAAAFFERFRALTAMGYYTTPIGMKVLGYTGNEPLPAFTGPPAEVLKQVGLA